MNRSKIHLIRALFVAGFLTSLTTAADVEQEITEQCRQDKALYGSTVVEACIDENIKAFDALKDYPPNIVERCQSVMGEHDWGIVKACADKDVQAATELSIYPSDYKPVIARCEEIMGEHGWATVKTCADQAIGAVLISRER